MLCNSMENMDDMDIDLLNLSLSPKTRPHFILLIYCCCSRPVMLIIETNTEFNVYCECLRSAFCADELENLTNTSPTVPRPQIL